MIITGKDPHLPIASSTRSLIAKTVIFFPPGFRKDTKGRETARQTDAQRDRHMYRHRREKGTQRHKMKKMENEINLERKRKAEREKEESSESTAEE